MNETIEQVSALLNWYRQLYGSSVYLEEELKSEFAEPAFQQPVIQKPAPANAPAQGAAPIPVKPASRSGIIIEQKSPELQEYYLEIKECQKCSLGKTRKNFVFGFGNPKAKVMFVGEAPGRDEDEKGIPFVGPAGKLLDKMLMAIGLIRDDVFIANVLKCRPPNNRDPLPDEIAHCEPYLVKQLEMINPKAIVALGRFAGQSLLKTDSSLSVLRSADQYYRDLPLLVTYHPAALLRNPRWKQNSWDDFKKLKKLL